MNTIYVYSYSLGEPNKTDSLIDSYEGSDNADCEMWASKNYGDTETYYWTYTPWEN